MTMLTPDVLTTFALWGDTSRQVRCLRDWQLLDTDPGDALLGYMAGNHPHQYSAIMEALGR